MRLKQQKLLLSTVVLRDTKEEEMRKATSYIVIK